MPRTSSEAVAPGRLSVHVLSPQVGGVGGAAVAALLLVESLVRSGARVSLFVTLPPSPVVASRLEALGVRVVTPFVSKGWKHGWPARQIAWRLKRFAGRERPAAVIAMGLTSEALHALRHSVPNLHLWENTEALPGNKFVDPRMPACLHRAAGLIAPSRTIEANVRSTYGWEGPVRRLPFWCDEPAWTNPPIRSAARIFLYVGRLDPDKGLLQLAEAFKRLHKTHPDARLVIAGGGSFPELDDAVRGAPNISCRGYVADADYEQLFADADACVLPSLHEGYPLSLIEACARSRPVIATRVGSIPEIFEGRAAALLVPPDDVGAIVEAAATLLDEDGSTYRHRCLDARRLYDEVASLNVIDRKVAALLEDIALAAPDHRTVDRSASRA